MGQTTESKPTPGPWTADEPWGGFSIIRAPSGVVMAVSAPGPKFGDREYSAEEKTANLALMAAAWEMYEALKASREVLVSCAKDVAGTPSEAFFMRKVAHCDAVLCKVEGR